MSPWACAACTLINDNASILSCLLCGAMKPSTTRCALLPITERLDSPPPVAKKRPPSIATASKVPTSKTARFTAPSHPFTTHFFPLHRIASFLHYDDIRHLIITSLSLLTQSLRPGSDLHYICSTASRRRFSMVEQWDWLMERHHIEHEWFDKLSTAQARGRSPRGLDIIPPLHTLLAKHAMLLVSKFYTDYSSAHRIADAIQQPTALHHSPCFCAVDLSEIMAQERVRVAVLRRIAATRWAHHALILFLRLVDASGFKPSWNRTKHQQLLRRACDDCIENCELASVVCLYVAAKIDGTIEEDTGIGEILNLLLPLGFALPVPDLAVWNVKKVTTKQSTAVKSFWRRERVLGIVNLVKCAIEVLLTKPPQRLGHTCGLSNDGAFMMLELFASTISKRVQLDKLEEASILFYATAASLTTLSFEPLLRAIACILVVFHCQDQHYDINDRQNQNSIAEERPKKTLLSNRTKKSEILLPLTIKHMTGISGREKEFMSVLSMVHTLYDEKVESSAQKLATLDDNYEKDKEEFTNGHGSDLLQDESILTSPYYFRNHRVPPEMFHIRRRFVTPLKPIRPPKI